MLRSLRSLLFVTTLVVISPVTSCSGKQELVFDPGASVEVVTISPDAADITTGQTFQLQVTLQDAAGNMLTGRPVTWTSGNESAATVSSSGAVTGVAPGSAVITATSEGKSGTATVTVINPPIPGNAVIAIDPSTMYQTMTGWEAVAQAGQAFDPQLFQIYKDTLFDLAANDLGVNRLRLEIQSGAENPTDYFTQFLNGQIDRVEWSRHWYEIINDNNDAFSADLSGFQFSSLDHTLDNVVLPMKQRVEANGATFYLNLNYVDFSGSSFEHYNFPDEYAELMLVTFQHMQAKYGFVPDAIEMILEPDVASGWSATQIANALVATGARLSANGFTPDFIAPSNTSMSNAVTYFDQMIQVSGVLSYLTDISYHRYSGVSLSNLQAIAGRAAQHGLRTSMLEHIGSGYQDLHDDLKIGRNSAWQQFTLGFPTNDNGAQYYTIDPNTGDVSIGSRTKYLRQYFKHVRLGSRRIEATSKDANLDPLAFINPDGTYVVVVKASGASSFSIGGLRAGRYGVSHTVSTAYGVEHPEIDVSSGTLLQTDIPSGGLITIYGKN